MQTILSHRSQMGSLRRGTGLLHLFSLCCSRLLVWQERSMQRQHLAGVEPHLLKDMGISPADVQSEVGKPFWRA